MDKELIFYIIFGLIYLLSRIGKKKKKPKTPTPGQSPQNTSPLNRPTARQSPTGSQSQGSSSRTQPVQEEEETSMSFEDILKELAGEKGSKKQTTPERATKHEPPARKPLVSEPAPKPEPTYYSDDEMTNEASKLWGAYKNESPTPVKPETSIGEGDYTDISYMQFDEYKVVDNSNPLTAEIREMLQDKEDVKKAVVLSEILQRRF